MIGEVVRHKGYQEVRVRAHGGAQTTTFRVELNCAQPPFFFSILARSGVRSGWVGMCRELVRFSGYLVLLSRVRAEVGFWANRSGSEWEFSSAHSLFLSLV